MDDIKIRRLGLAGHIIRMGDERNPKKGLNGKFHIKKDRERERETGRCCLDGHITDARMEEISRRKRRMEASSEGNMGKKRL